MICLGFCFYDPVGIRRCLSVLCTAQALQCAAKRIEALTRKSAHFCALQALSRLALQSLTFDSNTWVVPTSLAMLRFH